MMTKVSGSTLAKSVVAMALALACSPTVPAVGPATATSPPSPSTATAGAAPTPSPRPSAQAAPTDPPVPTSRPTPAPTATVWPPVFALWSLTDLRSLDAFVVKLNEKLTVNGRLNERTFTIGYIREPFSAYRWVEHRGGVEKTYVLNDRTYELTSNGDWYISAGATEGVFAQLDPAWGAGRLLEAQFADEGEYAGIPAYHFVLAGSPESQVQGEAYVAREGNYLLYSHAVETGPGSAAENSYEVTYALSSSDPLTEITLPADMEDMPAAADLPFENGLPLPPGSAFWGMIRYAVGSGIDIYQISTPPISPEEFLNFYRDLPTTDGWTVTHVGHVSLHLEDCEIILECVMLDNGHLQVVLLYTGARIRAEFDWPRRYSPLE